MLAEQHGTELLGSRRRVVERTDPHPEFWFDLERLILDSETQPSHYLMPQQKTRASRTSTARQSSTRCVGSWTSR